MQIKRDLQYEKFLSTVTFDPGTLRLLVRRVIHCAMNQCIGLIHMRRLCKSSKNSLPSISSGRMHASRKHFQIEGGGGTKSENRKSKIEVDNSLQSESKNKKN